MSFGNARCLVCRECGAEQDLGPFYVCPQCFGPLEVGYEFGAVTRAEIEAGPRSIWRYRALLPVRPDIADIPNLEPGFTRLVKADRLAGELGMRALWVKDDSGNPTHSFKDRVVAVALVRGPRARLHGARLPVDRKPRQRGRRRGGPGRDPQRRVHPVEPRAREGADDRGIRRHAGRRRRQLRRRQPARVGDRRRAAGLGVRERQRPAVLRRGLQDAGVRGRRAARLAAAGPGGDPGRLRLAAHQGRQGLR